MTKLENITWGHRVISTETKPSFHNTHNVETIEMKKPRGKKIILAVISLAFDGSYISHTVIG